MSILASIFKISYILKYHSYNILSKIMYTKFRYFLIYYEKRFNISFHYFSIFRLLTSNRKIFLKRIDTPIKLEIINFLN